MKSTLVSSVTYWADFPRNTIEIQRTESNSKRVHLSSVTLASSSHYRCEVSAEAPSFSSVSGGGYMEVVVLPRQRPVIAGGRSNYRPGDLVDVNCTSAASKPAANIRWFINDKKVPVIQFSTSLILMRSIICSKHYMNSK